MKLSVQILFVNKMRIRDLPLILSLFLLTSCGMLANMSEGISSARQMLGEVNKTYQELKPSIDSAVSTTKNLIADGKRIYEQGTEIASELKSTGAEFRNMSAEARAKADKDGDGELSLMERLAYLITLGGGAAEIARRKLKATKNQFAALTGKVDHERAKRKQAEAAVS